MKAFTELYSALDETTKTTSKVRALVRYFVSASPADAAWAVYFLCGRKPRQAVPTRKLAQWAAEEAGVADWLFEESYHAVGDLAETIALLLPAPVRSDPAPLREWVDRLLGFRNVDETTVRQGLLEAWRSLDAQQRFVLNKLITGAFRVGVSQQLLIRGLAEASGTEPSVVAHRLMGNWEPTAEFYESLFQSETSKEDVSRPYPFFLATPLDGEPTELGEVADWQAEWKWDGIRAQLIRRSGQTFLWSRGEELITERFPEISEVASLLPEGTVIDGEVLPWRDGSVMPFAQLQRRIGRKTLGKKLLAEVPVVLMAYDLLEMDRTDWRERPLSERRARLAELVNATPTDGRLLLSPTAQGASWQELAQARQESRSRQVEGLMLKRLSSPYRVGRQRGDWWKWKINPLTIDAVLIYAQRGSGKRASLYTDYTFGVWDNGELVPVAKAYSGLTDEEIRRVDEFVRKYTMEKFGPVRSVTAELVFELAFEGMQRSPRHKSGIAVRFPRILRWRTDKKAQEADTLERVKAMLTE